MNFFGMLFCDFAQEFQREMCRFDSHPSGGTGDCTEFTLDFGETFANVFRKFDANKKSHYILINTRRVRSSAACDVHDRIRSRFPGNIRWRCSVPPGPATAICTVPTGLSGVPPPGPAMPVTPTPTSVDAFLRIPSAIATATGSLTAPCSAISATGTPSDSVFARLL